MSEQFNANNVQEELSEQQLQDIAGGKATTKIVFEEPKPLSPDEQRLADAVLKQLREALGGPIDSVFPNNPPGGSSTTGSGSSTTGGSSNPTN